MPLGRHTLASRTLGGPRVDTPTVVYHDHEIVALDWKTYAWDADQTLIAIDWSTHVDYTDSELASLEWNVGIIGDHQVVGIEWGTTRELPDRELAGIDWGVFWRVNADRKMATISWDVLQATEYADSELAEVNWSVSRRLTERAMLGTWWRVYNESAPAPTGRRYTDHVVVYIDGQDVSGRVKVNSVTVTHGEDQASSASITLLYEIDAPIMIPSLNGKPLTIEAYNDPTDPAAGTWRMFTGWIERSEYNRAARAVNITGSDLRSERLGGEDQGDLLQLTQAVYSEITQREDATGDAFVSEMMRTVSGSIGYDKSGNLNFYSWLIDGMTPALTLTDSDVSTSDIAIDYQTRSEIVNVVTIKMSYRYTGLRTMRTELHGEQSVREWGGSYAGSFIRSTIVDRIQSGFGSWIAVDYDLIDMPTIKQVQGVFGRYIAYARDPNRCMGYRATLERYIAQPITEEYSIRVVAPQSIRAYGKEIAGSDMSFSVDDNSDFDRSAFEDRDTVYQPTMKTSPSGLFKWPTGGTLVRQRDVGTMSSYIASTADGLGLPVAEGKRALFNAGMMAATLMARKEIRAAHRKNYIDVLKHSLVDIELGDVVQLDTRVISTVGQCTGITYTISDQIGLRTKIKLQVSSMDDTGPAPAESWLPPGAPTLTAAGSPSTLTAPKTTTRNGSTNFNLQDKVLEVTAPEVPERYTDEVVTNVSKVYEMALENQSITLINGW